MAEKDTAVKQVKWEPEASTPDVCAVNFERYFLHHKHNFCKHYVREIININF